MGKLIMNEPSTFVITGPECTGKTTLAKGLAEHFSNPWIPEYARDYIQNLSRPYTYQDIEHIAGIQISQLKEFQEKAKTLLFVDTFLIITKIWFDVVYSHYPKWIDEALKNMNIDLFFLCYPDLKWAPDKTRENGGEMRMILFERYEDELKRLQQDYVLIKGNERIETAIEEVSNYLKRKKL